MLAGRFVSPEHGVARNNARRPANPGLTVALLAVRSGVAPTLSDTTDPVPLALRRGARTRTSSGRDSKSWLLAAAAGCSARNTDPGLLAAGCLVCASAALRAFAGSGCNVKSAHFSFLLQRPAWADVLAGPPGQPASLCAECSRRIYLFRRQDSRTATPSPGIVAPGCHAAGRPGRQTATA